MDGVAPIDVGDVANVNHEPSSPDLQLSVAAAAALQEFYKEQQQQSEADPFAANFGLSQFWYTEETAAVVAQEAIQLADGGAIACVACPSLFRHIRKHYPDVSAHLFEIDTRFEVLGDFSLYDYNEPLAVPPHLQHHFSVVVADPPYLAEECLSKTATTMRLLTKQPKEDLRFLLLTGAVMEHDALELLSMRPTGFLPEHSHKLGNDFLLYASSEPSFALKKVINSAEAHK